MLENFKINQDLKSFSIFEKKKYLSYLGIIRDRLNKIHDMDEDKSYWEKVVGFFFLIHVAQCAFVFYKNKKNKLDYNDTLITIPWDEQNYRTLFIDTGVGKKSLSRLLEKGLSNSKYENISNKMVTSPMISKSFLGIFKYFSFIQFIKEIMIRAFQKFIAPKAIIIEAYWDKANMQKIQIGSGFKIQNKSFEFGNNNSSIDVNSNARDIISDTSNISDNFDKFFFKSLKFSTPTSIIERFRFKLNDAEDLLSKFKRLKFIFNESASPDALLFIAQAKKRQIKSYYIEHNYLQHQFEGNTIWYLKSKYDYFLSLGWKSDGDQKHIASSSNFNWFNVQEKNKSIHLLYLSGIATKQYPHFSAGYGESGNFRAKLYVDMKTAFMNSLNEQVIKKIYYKDYPKYRRKIENEHELNIHFRENIKDKVQYYDEEGEISTPELVSKSKLVICDYLSTPYNQALLSGVPTIILFNDLAYPLKNDYSDFYQKLIEAKIFFANPEDAGSFINKGMENIFSWWNSKIVQDARKEYLRTNFGDYQLINKQIFKILRS